MGISRLPAHEFWLQPSTFRPSSGETFELQLQVGMDFKGEIRPFTRQRVVSLTLHSAEGRENRIEQVRTDLAPEPAGQPLRIDAPGFHLIAVDSTPSLITLEAKKFNDYLKAEGLERVIEQRNLEGSANLPGRERYVRCVKTVIRVGDRNDTGGYQSTGQRLEIVPMAPSLELPGAGVFRATLLFEGRPLEGALVRGWQRTGDQLRTLASRSDPQGGVSFALPTGGVWMFSIVHMVRLQGVPEADWGSIWGNLTVSLGEVKTASTSLPPGHALPRFDQRPGLVSPAGPESGESNLVAGPDGTLYLTWCAPGRQPRERGLYLSTLAPNERTWSDVRQVVSNPLLMENWADFASMIVGTDGTLWAQWLQSHAGEDVHGYEGWIARSKDAGSTWSTPAPLGHEFVSLAPLSGGRLIAVWLESTRPPRPPGAPRPPRVERKPGELTPPSMRLRSRLLRADGTTAADWIVDPDVCTCCQTTLTVLPGDRVFVAYRGRTSEEIRDIRRALFNGKQWAPPASLHDDGWMIPACPVNGPAADARGENVTAAWFTLAGSVPRVQAKQSFDGGATFGPALPIDLGKPIGRLDLVTLSDGSSILIWMESKSGDNAAGIYARRIFPGGQLSTAHLLADSSQARTSGFPRAAARGEGRFILSWTQPGEPTQVRVREWDSSEFGGPAPILPAVSASVSGKPEVCAPERPAN